MKNTIKTILLFFTAAILITSCDSDDKNPPTAGFSLSNMDPVQWDTSTIASSAIAADEISYTVTGGEFVWIDAATIQFLDDNSYTITQTVTNTDGTDTTAITVDVAEPNNTYDLDGTEMPITSNAFWYDASAMGGTIYIRFLADVAGQDNPNLLKLYPESGPNPIQGTYTWDDSGDIGTYDAGMTANYAGFSFDWTTKGDNGDNLKIELVYEDTNSDNNIYDITLSSYTLNYGNWDWAIPAFVSEGTKSFSVSYRGAIDPIAAP